MSPFTDAASLAGWFPPETGLTKKELKTLRMQMYDNELENITFQVITEAKQKTKRCNPKMRDPHVDNASFTVKVN